MLRLRALADVDAAATHVDLERRLEDDHLEDAQLAGELQRERLGRNQHAARVPGDRRRVDQEVAGSLDLHDAEHVDVHRDGQAQRETRMRVRVDPREADDR